MMAKEDFVFTHIMMAKEDFVFTHIMMAKEDFVFTLMIADTSYDKIQKIVFYHHRRLHLIINLEI